MNSRISCKGIPSCTRCGGSASISPNCRLEQISCRSASNTAMPCRTWFSAVCRISRLKCSAAWESSSSLSAAFAETVRLRSSSDITRRDEAAPIDGRDQVLGMLQQFEIGRRRRFERAGMLGCESLEGVAGALGTEILRHRALDILNRDGGAPAPEGRRDRGEGVRHEQVGLQALDRRRRACERHDDVSQDVERQAPQHAVQQRRQIGAEQRLRPQRLDAERAMLQQQQAGCAVFKEARQEQRVDPHGNADQHAADGAARGRLPPEQSAEERRRKLGDRRERQQADRRQLGVAERAVVEIRHHHDGEDRKAAHRSRKSPKSFLRGAGFRAPLQHQRYHDVVGNHDRQRDAFHDHHRGRRRQAADEDDHAEQGCVRLDRQRQHEHVGCRRRRTERSRGPR